MGYDLGSNSFKDYQQMSKVVASKERVKGKAFLSQFLLYLYEYFPEFLHLMREVGGTLKIIYIEEGGESLNNISSQVHIICLYSYLKFKKCRDAYNLKKNMFNVSKLHRKSIKWFHQKLWVELIGPCMAYNSISIKPYIKSHLELQRKITLIELAPSPYFFV